MPVRLEHPENAELPIEVTELGVSMLVRLEQPTKASSPIEVTLNSVPSISTEVGIATLVGSPV